MSYRIRDNIYPTGLTKTIIAPTLEDLRMALNELHDNGFGLNVGWHGWDDGSLIAHRSGPHLHIEPKEPDA